MLEETAYHVAHLDLHRRHHQAGLGDHSQRSRHRDSHTRPLVQRRAWLAVQFVGIPSDTIEHVALGVWLASGAALLYPRAQDLLAWKVWRLRPPSELESRRIGPAWWAVCTAAGVNPDRYRVWIHEGPEATAPQTAGATVAVTSWSVFTLPPRNLEAVLAHELAHRLAVPG
jgi:STE24 endopeptidase